IRSSPRCTTSAHFCCLPLPTMVIGLLAPFRRLLLTRGCQQDPCFVGGLFAGRSPTATRKKSAGLCRVANVCGVSHGQMAKVEQRNCLENSLRHLERASVATRCTRMGTPSTLLGRSRTPIRDLSRISKQFQKVNSQKFAC